MSVLIALPSEIDPSLIPEFNHRIGLAKERAALLTHNLRIPPNASPELVTLIVLGRCINILKEEKRWNGRRVEAPESVADHMSDLALRVMFIAQLRGYDVMRAMMIALAHDIPELLLTDIIIYIYPPEEQAKIKTMKRELEYIAMNLVAQAIGGAFGKMLFQLWLEYENRSSREGILVKETDKILAAETAMHYNSKPANDLPLQEILDSVEATNLTDPLLCEMLKYMQTIATEGEEAETKRTA